jgi:hypothetical protein
MFVNDVANSSTYITVVTCIVEAVTEALSSIDVNLGALSVVLLPVGVSLVLETLLSAMIVGVSGIMMLVFSTFNGVLGKIVLIMDRSVLIDVSRTPKVEDRLTTKVCELCTVTPAGIKRDVVTIAEVVVAVLLL